MATVAELLVKIGADISSLGTGLREADLKLDSFVVQTEKAALSTQTLAIAAAAAGAAILALLGLSVRQAAEARREQELLAAAIRASGKAIEQTALEAQAANLQRSLGISDETILSVDRLLVNYGATQEQIEQLVPRILDFAVATGRDATDAALTFGRALTGQDMALRRVLGKMGEGISLSENFAGAMELLDRRFGGTAAAASNTLGGALSKLRTQLSELQETMGDPLLRPLISFLNVLTALITRVNEFAQAHPAATTAIATFTAVVGTMLLGTGGLLALRAILPHLIAGLSALGPVLFANAAALQAAGTSTFLFVTALRLLQLALIGLGIGAVITGLVLLVTHLKEVNEWVQSVAFVTIRAYQLWRSENISLGEAVKRARGELQQMRDELARQKKAAEDARVTVEELAKAYDEIAASAKLAATQQALSATQAARLKLEAGGLTSADLRAIETARLREVRAATIRELQLKVRAKEAEIAALARADDASDAVRKKKAQELADLQSQLEEQRRQDVAEVADANVKAVEREVEERRRIELQLLQDTLAVERARSEAARSAAQERASADATIAAERLRVIRLEEETRVAMLTRMARLEQTLAAAVIDAREGLLRQQLARVEIQAAREAAARAKAVREGFITEEQAEQQAATARAARERQRLEGELAIQQQRIVQVQRAFQIELALAQEVAQSKQRVLALETDAQKRALVEQQRAREFDLQASLAILRAETTAKITELNVQLEAKRAELRAELAAQEAVGAITAEQRRSIEGQLDAATAGFRSAITTLNTQLDEQQRSANSIIASQREALAAQLTGIDKAAAEEQRQIQAELAQTILQLTSQNVADRQAAMEKLTSLELDATRFLLEEEERLRQQFEAGLITREQADRQLQPFKNIVETIQRISRVEGAEVETQLGIIESAWKGLAERLGLALKPLKELIESILAPLRDGTLALPSLPAGAQPTPAAVGVGGGALVGAQTFNFNVGTVTLTLTMDEQRALQRVIEALFGPEGRALFDRYVRSQPGPRS